MSVLGSVTGLPAWHPPHDVLELAELVLDGAIRTLPVPIPLPPELAGAEAVVLTDAEGTPVAVLRRSLEPSSLEPPSLEPPSLEPPSLEPLRPFTHGPLRADRRTPAQIRAVLLQGAGTAADAGTVADAGTGAGTGPGGDGGERIREVLAVVVTAPLTTIEVQTVLARAAAAGGGLLWLAVFGSGRDPGLPPTALWRAVRSLADSSTVPGQPAVAVPVAVPLLSRSEAGATLPIELLESVALAYGGTQVLRPGAAHLDAVPADPDQLHPAFARELERAVSPPHRRGVTIFFTGLSGSGKSTVAKALAVELSEHHHRTVSLLDGDEVRRMLSAGLGFSRADRDLNIRRIGFVATEVTRHGGVAICAPIAPFAQTREQVRADVESAGDFVLIHVSTPLAECERRDRKGLYAKARRGEIADFTGISSPYQEPVDADLRLDTSHLDVPEAVSAVLTLLGARGYLAGAADPRAEEKCSSGGPFSPARD